MTLGLFDAAFLGTAGTPVGPTDPNFANVSLLLHGDGPNGSQDIIDSSSSPKTGTAVGNAQISTAQSKFSGSSIVFDKVNDRVTYNASSAFAFGTGDFTIEMWIYSRDVSGSTQRGLLQISDILGGLSVSTNGIWIFQGANNTGGSLNGGIAIRVFSTIVGASSAVLTVNQWSHIAFCRQGSILMAFANGNLLNTKTNSSNLTQSNLVIGGYFSDAFLHDGYIDDLRITKGVARYYTDNFTPPTAPFPDA